MLARALHASEGNPLFLGELLRLLVDDGVLVRATAGGERPSRRAASSCPPRSTPLLAARIEQLRPEERHVLRGGLRHRASLPSRRRPTRCSPRTSPLTSTPISTRSGGSELVDAESSWWASDRLYRFHHALIRDAAYRRVLKEVRADLHARYSTGSRHGCGSVSEQDEALGWHLEQAHGFRASSASSTTRRPAGSPNAPAPISRRGQARAFDRDDVASAASLLGRALARARRRPAPARAHAMALRRADRMRRHRSGIRAVAELVASATTDHAAAIADVFDAQLASQRSPDELRSVAERTARAAKVFAEHGDDTGVAHTELVLAGAMAALGQVAACEAALDRALAAARRGDDRRRANAVLAIAPLAALWGPSPVARASGRCLDVIRVLRITSWAPHVEAHALRAQAVLEALRDRAEASRRMMESARRTFADLGQPLGLLEVETHAGIVELLAGDAGAAEPHLRKARDGFNELGSQSARPGRRRCSHALFSSSIVSTRRQTLRTPRSVVTT